VVGNGTNRLANDLTALLIRGDILKPILCENGLRNPLNPPSTAELGLTATDESNLFILVKDVVIDVALLILQPRVAVRGLLLEVGDLPVFATILKPITEAKGTADPLEIEVLVGADAVLGGVDIALTKVIGEARNVLKDKLAEGNHLEVWIIWIIMRGLLCAATQTGSHQLGFVLILKDSSVGFIPYTGDTPRGRGGRCFNFILGVKVFPNFSLRLSYPRTERVATRPKGIVVLPSPEDEAKIPEDDEEVDGEEHYKECLIHRPEREEEVIEEISFHLESWIIWIIMRIAVVLPRPALISSVSS